MTAETWAMLALISGTGVVTLAIVGAALYWLDQRSGRGL